MTNREFIIAEVQKKEHTIRLIDVFESLYEYDPKKFPVRSACDRCMEEHGGDCPDETDPLNSVLCDAAARQWLDAEAVYK
ncbi:MAG: hypothetical protein J6T26_08035 [Firmicutes bacterium]|nr:hypothetical protein [Bacillota bacterium]